jgi:integrase
MTSKVNLTDARIRDLRPDSTGKRRPALRDTQVPNLIVIAHRQHKTFALHARFPGSRNPTRRQIGLVGALSVADARDVARQWLMLIRKGIDPAVEKKAREAEARKDRENEELRGERLFKVVAETYLVRKVAKQRQHRVVERIVRNILIKQWGDRPINEITRRDVIELVEAIADRPAATYAFATFSVVRRLFNWNLDRDLYGLDKSPCDRVRIGSLLGAAKQPRQRMLSDDEILCLWKATKRLPYPWQPLFRLLLLTGTRRNEAAGACWSEFSGDRWTIPSERFKSGFSHLVPLSADAQALLAALPRFRSGDCLFSFNFGQTPITKFSVAKKRLDQLMLRYLKALARLRGDDPSRAVLTPWIIHDLRRVVRTKMAALSIRDNVAKMCVGHAKRGLERVYNQHAYTEEMREAFERWAAELRRITQREPRGDNVVSLRTVA